MGFVPCGEERVRVFAAEDRAEKPGVQRLEAATASMEAIADELAGYRVQ
jgi:molybdate-binding protein